MNPKVTVVDYGVGNLFSVRAAFEHTGADVIMSSDADEIARADRILLPGVGAFGDAMADMRDNGLVEPVLAFSDRGGPLLGICLGMQMLMDESEEFGRHSGLGLIAGAVVPVPATGADGRAHPVPHVGWNALDPAGRDGWAGTLFSGIRDGDAVYFAHSFMAVPGASEHAIAQCGYDGREICAAVQRGNVFGCQFHPEKSGPVGLAIIRNFLDE